LTIVNSTNSAGGGTGGGNGGSTGSGCTLINNIQVFCGNDTVNATTNGSTGGGTGGCTGGGTVPVLNNCNSTNVLVD
jgi:hypothetical protein